MGDATIQLFTSHHIEIPEKWTPRTILDQINIWVFKTFHREWQVLASDFPEALIPHGPLDPFEPIDPTDSDDPLNHLDPLAPPRYTLGFCETTGCSNATYLYAYCSACCRRKWQVAVRKTTYIVPSVGQPVGLGLFATSDLPGGKYICNITCNMLFGHDCLDSIFNAG